MPPSEPTSLRELHQQAASRPVPVSFHVQLESLRQKTTKTGNPYYELRFADAEETLVLRVWSDSPQFATCSSLQEKKFYEVSGSFGLGNDGRSIDSREWQARALSDQEAAGVLAGSAELQKKQAEDFALIQQIIGTIVDPRLRILCARFLEKFGDRFRRTGAARDYHHARRGGLVEHVSRMMLSAVKICEAYPLLNRDLLVTGVLFHDAGKLWENAYSENGFSMPYTEVSELLGHIPMGMELVNKIWRDLLDDPISEGWRDLDPPSEKVRLHLLHLIVSHHGELAFGSPVVPKTPEAQALHYIDNLDAKMEMFERGYEVAGELGKNVLERVRPLPGRLVLPLPSFPEESPSVVKEPESPTYPATQSQPTEPLQSTETAHDESPMPAGEEEEIEGDGLPIPPPPETFPENDPF